MRDLYDQWTWAEMMTRVRAQLARTFEVLVARQYFAPWNQIASRDCRDC